MISLYDKVIYISTLFSLLFSVFLWFTGQKDEGLFVAIWVPSLLSVGIYTKLNMSIPLNLNKKREKDV